MKKNIVIFDFDGTLTPHTLPKFEVLEKCGYSNGLSDVKFLSKVLARIPKCIDKYHALYETFLNIIANSKFPLTDETVAMGADKIEFNEGVQEFLKFLKNNGVKSYILSSGIKPYLEKSNIREFVSEIFATTFDYNLKGEIAGIKFCMNDQSKVNAIKAILKMNKLSVSDMSNIIYIGDGLTDIPAMNYVKKNGGTAIFVVDELNIKEADIVIEKDIASFLVKKDFTWGSELFKIIENACILNIKRNGL